MIQENNLIYEEYVDIIKTFEWGMYKWIEKDN